MDFLKQTNRKNTTWTANKLVSQIDSGKATFDNEVQRALVWNIRQKSLLIHSIILDLAIPPLYAVTEDKRFDFIDGKQRSYAIYDFIYNRYALTDTPLIEYEDGTSKDINGLRFKDLDENIQNAIKDYTFNIVTFDAIDQDLVADMFFRLNNGTSLKATDKNFSKAISKSQIIKLSDHNIFNVALTTNARKKFAQRTIVIQCLIMLKDKNPCFDAKFISNFLKSVEITDDDVAKLTGIFNSFREVYDKLSEDTKANHFAIKKMLSRGNIPTLTPLMEKYDDNEKLSDFIKYFFGGDKGACINEEYTLASSQGAGHAVNIQKRLKILEKEWKKFSK